MKENPKYEWYSDNGVAICTIYYKGKEFSGNAMCHDDDLDMKSRLTGQLIAEFRAQIKVLSYIRDYEIIPELKGVKQVYYAMSRSKHFNPNSYENYMLQRHIRRLEKQLTTIRTEISNARKNLKDYINVKDKYYKTVRAKRTAEGEIE